MTEYDAFIYIDCKAEIACVRCGNLEDASGGSEREALGYLNSYLKRDGWQVIDGKLLCGECARKGKK